MLNPSYQESQIWLQKLRDGDYEGAMLLAQSRRRPKEMVETPPENSETLTTDATSKECTTTV